MSGNADLAEPCPECHCLVLPIDKLPHDRWHATLVPPVDECPNIYMAGSELIQVRTNTGWVNIHAGSPPGHPAPPVAEAPPGAPSMFYDR